MALSRKERDALRKRQQDFMMRALYALNDAYKKMTHEIRFEAEQWQYAHASPKAIVLWPGMVDYLDPVYFDALTKQIFPDAVKQGVVFERTPPRQKEIIKDDLRWEVWERDNFTCKHCGTRRNLTVDHILPESKGGTLALDNLQTLCKSCNSKKGARA